MYLLDTNIWLERLLNQARAAEVKQLLDAVDSTELALSDFSLHSICVILGRSVRFGMALASGAQPGANTSTRTSGSSVEHRLAKRGWNGRLDSR